MNCKLTLLFFISAILMLSCTKINPSDFATADHAHQEYSDTSHTHSSEQYIQYDFSAKFPAIDGELYTYTIVNLPKEISDTTHCIFIQVELSGMGWVMMPFTYFGKALTYSVSGNILKLFIMSATSNDLYIEETTYNFKVTAIPKESLTKNGSLLSPLKY